MQIDDDYLIHQFLVVSRFFVKTLNNQIAAYDCYSSGWAVLNFLAHQEGVLQTELAARLQVELAAVSKTCKRLEEKGFICRKVKSDKREKYIYLTAKGRAHHEELAAVVARHRQAVLAGLTAEEKENLLCSLKKINTNLSKF